jgi:serine/threonine protein kinase
MIRQNLPPDAILIGEKFLVGRTLGEGSFGQIQLGTNIETGDFVAIKIVRNNFLLI